MVNLNYKWIIKPEPGTFSYKCAVCGTMVLVESAQTGLGISDGVNYPASRYWKEDKTQVYCSPECSISIHNKTYE